MVLLRLERRYSLTEIAEHFDITRQSVSYAFDQLDKAIIAAFPHLGRRKAATNRHNYPRMRLRSEFADNGRQARSRSERIAHTNAGRL